MRTLFTVAVTAFLVGATWTHAQEAPVLSPSKLYEKGSYETAADRVKSGLESGEVAPEDLYWAGQSLVRLDRRGEAVEIFRRLGGGDEASPWTAVGRSAAALAEGQQQVGLQQSARAVEIGPELFFAHYQSGLARLDAQQWQSAAASFERATEIDGNAAYAHYHAGMAYNRARRLERTVVHLNRFIELAPGAPEAETVRQVLKALQGLR